MKKIILIVFTAMVWQLSNAQQPVTIYYDWNKLHPKQKYTTNSAGQISGAYTEYNSKGVVVREYNYINGEKNGLCLDYIAKENNQRDISLKATYKVGKLDGYYLENCFVNEGEFVQYQAFKGKKEEGQYKDGTKVGLWKEWWCQDAVPGGQAERSNVLKSVGAYSEEGKNTGEWKRYTESGSLLSSGLYKDGTREGRWLLYDDTDTGKLLIAGNYLAGKRVNEWTIYYDSHDEETDYKSTASYYRKVVFDNDGVPFGKVSDYYLSGEKLWEGQLSSVSPRIREGLSTYYWPNGNKREEATYFSDKAMGKYNLYYESGKIRQDAMMKNGELNGPVKIYYEDGPLKIDAIYTAGKASGECSTYYPTGKLKAIEKYYLNELNGGTYYNEDGTETTLERQIQAKKDADKSLSDSLSVVAKALYTSKDYNGAIKQYEYKEQNLSGLSSLDFYYSGLCYLMTGDSLKADAALAAFIQKSPSSPEGYFWRARTNLKLGKPEEWRSMPYYQKYIEIAASDPEKYKANLVESCIYMGVYYSEKDKAKAKEYLNRALYLEPGNPTATQFINELK